MDRRDAGHGLSGRHRKGDGKECFGAERLHRYPRCARPKAALVIRGNLGRSLGCSGGSRVKSPKGLSIARGRHETQCFYGERTALWPGVGRAENIAIKDAQCEQSHQRKKDQDETPRARVDEPGVLARVLLGVGDREPAAVKASPHGQPDCYEQDYQ